MENKFHGQRHSVFLECEAESFLKSKFGEKVQSDSCMYKIALQTFMNFCRHFADCAFIFNFYNGKKNCALLNVEFFRICTRGFELYWNVYCLSLSVTHLNINIRV